MNQYNEKVDAVANRLNLTATDVNALADAVLSVGHLVRAFSRVRRSVPMDRKGSQESDSDHTVLLSLVACCVAAKHAAILQLDIGKVAQYALVHDLLEAYSGDTNTMEYGDLDEEEKKKREEKALAGASRAVAFVLSK